MLNRMAQHNSRSTTLSPIGSAPVPVAHIYGKIPAGYTFRVQSLDITITVIQGFLVQVASGQDGYQVTSAISYAYAFGDTPGQAIEQYLEAVVEQLDWLQRHEASLSVSVHHELVCLQQYLRIL